MGPSTLAAVALGLLLPVVAVGNLTLPARTAQVIADGDPREAFLQGALSLPMFDAVTGGRDGSLRAFTMATPEGLYVALLSTEAAGSKLCLAPAEAEGADILLGEWMAVRVLKGGPPLDGRLFALTPDGRRLCLRDDGEVSAVTPTGWMAAGKLFGYTWAGEWILPWETLGLKGGEAFRLEILRGRKAIFPASTVEVLSRATPGTGASRWGGEGIPFIVPAAFPEPESGLFALEDFEVRPYVPADDRKASCLSRVPAGEVATAWLEWRGEGMDVRLEPGRAVAKGPGATWATDDAQVFVLDFWWQAGKRTEQDAAFPGRVASGEGDVFVAERLFPQDARGVRCRAGECARYLVTWRVPRGCPPGELVIPLTTEGRTGPSRQVKWRIEVTAPLPDVPFLAGIYYITPDEGRWEADIADIAEHGFNAVTCPARSREAWVRFKALAKKHGVRGNFALYPDGLVPEEGDWAYAWDEPYSAQTLRQAEERAASLSKAGWRTWAALCWLPVGDLPRLLNACAFSPNMLEDRHSLPRVAGEIWTYIQGLREDPAYNRGQLTQRAEEEIVSGLWVFCYRPERERPLDDWLQPPLRYDACVLPWQGRSLPTVEWEALRRGILEARIERAGRKP